MRTTTAAQAGALLALLFRRIPMLARYGRAIRVCISRMGALRPLRNPYARRYTRVGDSARLASVGEAYFSRGIPRDGTCAEGGRLAPGVCV